MGKVGPGMEEQYLALSVREAGKSLGQHWSHCRGIEAIIRVGAQRRLEAPFCGARVGAQAALLPASVHAQEVGGDSVEPGQCGLALTIEPMSSAKSPRERLGGELLREGSAHPPPEIAINRRDVAIEDSLEALRPLA